MIRVLLADDHQIVREGLRALIAVRKDMAVIAEADNGRSAIELARAHRPDIVIMDISMPELNGVDASRQILAEVPGAKVIALSMHSGRHYVDGMLRSGASGYLLKDCAAEELIHCIHVVRSGRVFISPGVAAFIVGRFIEPDRESEPSAGQGLSERERMVLQQIAEGRSTREISETLHISIKTVETHRKNIMDKLSLFTVADLTKHAIRIGLTDLIS